MKLFLALLLLLAIPARAEETGWIAFPEQCHSELKPDWRVQAAAGAAWEADSVENTRRIAQLTDRICPDYFARPNDTDAIRAFNEAKGYILFHSPAVEKEGRRLLDFLTGGLNENQQLFASVEIDFSATPCGVHMLGTRERMAARLADLRVRIERLAGSCFSRADSEGEKARASAAPKPHAQGAPARVPAAAGAGAKGHGSDITGTEQDAAKRRKSGTPEK